MQKKIRILAIVLALAAIMLTLPACSGSRSSGAIKIGIVQMADNGAFTDMREGYIARLRALGYGEDKVVFEYKNAQGDMTALNSIGQSMVDAKVKAIVTIGTPATQAVVNLESKIPTFFISVSNPVGAGVITDLKKPDKNATGTSNAIPVDEMFKLSDKLTPGRKTYGLIYCTSEVNSVTTIKNAKAYMEKNGIAYKEAVVTASAEVAQAAQSLVGKVDALFIPNDSVVQSALAQVTQLAREARIPVYGSSAVMVATGAFATISIDDPTIGAMTADMTDKYLKGTAIDQIPAVVVSQFTTVVNQTTADAIGVKFAPDILAAAKVLK